LLPEKSELKFLVIPSPAEGRFSGKSRITTENLITCRSYGPTEHLKVETDEYEVKFNDEWQRNTKREKKPDPVSHCPPKIIHTLPWN
jgi:hypothetical protein